MIIWSGLGFLPVVFFILISFFIYDHDPKGFGATNNPIAYTLLLTGIITFVIGYLLRRRPERTLVDKATGREVHFRASHSFFFIPLVYCGPLFMVWAVYLLMTGR
jgi:hypothetical protein